MDFDSIDYTKATDYDCPKCPWSLHVESRVWDEVEDHSLVIAYIQKEVTKHMGKTHMYEVSKNLEDYNTPYLYYSVDSVMNENKQEK